MARTVGVRPKIWLGGVQTSKALKSPQARKGVRRNVRVKDSHKPLYEVKRWSFLVEE